MGFRPGRGSYDDGIIYGDHFDGVHGDIHQLTGSLEVKGGLIITGTGSTPMLVLDDSDAYADIGRARLGYDGTNSDWAIFGHQDMATSANFAFRQRNTGQTEINAKSGQSVSIKIATANGLVITQHRQVLPGTDNLQDLGSADYRWANIYTGDLHLKNDRGDWTVIEEEDFLTIKNNKNGKRYKLLMEELED
tara:strand:+ start:817 stop:1392 length:576 start_codon:yes stop_codon:yes gene_type:complete